jgi:hypothetical protein
LGGEDLVGDSRGELAIFQQARSLGCRRAGDNDYRGKVALRLGFIQQRDIDAKPATVPSRGCGVFRPRSPDGGMKDKLKFTALRGIGKGGFPEPDPVGLARRVKGPRSEST